MPGQTPFLPVRNQHPASTRAGSWPRRDIGVRVIACCMLADVRSATTPAVIDHCAGGQGRGGTSGSGGRTAADQPNRDEQRRAGMRTRTTGRAGQQQAPSPRAGGLYRSACSSGAISRVWVAGTVARSDRDFPGRNPDVGPVSAELAAVGMPSGRSTAILARPPAHLLWSRGGLRRAAEFWKFGPGESRPA